MSDDSLPDDAPENISDDIIEEAPLDELDDDMVLQEEDSSPPQPPSARKRDTDAGRSPSTKQKAARASDSGTGRRLKKSRRDTSATAGTSRKSPIVLAAGKTAEGVKRAAGWAKAVSGDAKRAVVDGAQSERELRTLQALLATTSALAVLFLILTIIGFSSGDVEDETDTQVTAAANDHIVAETERTLAVDSEAEARLVALRERSARLEADLATTQNNALNLKAGLEKAKEQVESLKSRIAEGDATDERSSERVREIESELDDVRAELSAAKLEAAAAISRERKLAAELPQLEEARDTVLESASAAEAREAKLKAQIAALEEELQSIEEMLPPEPLSHVEAGRRFRQAVDAMRDETSREERIAKLRDLEFTLAGTRYAQAVARLRENEINLMDRDDERAAADAYKTVARLVRSNKADSEGNLAALDEALKKVEGSEKYTKLVKDLIDKESVKSQE